MSLKYQASLPRLPLTRCEKRSRVPDIHRCSKQVNGLSRQRRIIRLANIFFFLTSRVSRLFLVTDKNRVLFRASRTCFSPDAAFELRSPALGDPLGHTLEPVVVTRNLSARYKRDNIIPWHIYLVYLFSRIPSAVANNKCEFEYVQTFIRTRVV